MEDNKEIENKSEIIMEEDSVSGREREASSFTRGLVMGMAIAVILFSVVLTLVFIIGSGSKSKRKDSMIANDEVSAKVEQLSNVLRTYYYEDVDDEEIRNGIYYGVMESVKDPYTCYYTKEEMEAMSQNLQGTYKGVGLYLSENPEGGYPVTNGSIPGSPADVDEISIGDNLIKVDGADVYGMTLTDVVALVRGEEGSSVTLTLRNDSGDYEVTLVRKELETETVKYELFDNNVAYIIITEFDEVTKKQFKEAMEKLRSDNAEGLILDLRGNPGGNVDAVVEVAGELLPEGIVVYMEDKNGERVDYTCDGEHEIDIPVVVLVDGSSASAAEILSGAIKDYEKGTLVGTKTYGKGVVQSVISLKDGSAVKVTTSKYYTPNGYNIHKVGIEPDVEVKFDASVYLKDKTDTQLEEAKKIMDEEIKKQ